MINDFMPNLPELSNELRTNRKPDTYTNTQTKSITVRIHNSLWEKIEKLKHTPHQRFTITEIVNSALIEWFENKEQVSQ
jgi:hypothetical protein